MGRTDGLFATPTFLTGAGRTLDLWAAQEAYSYDYSSTPEEADYQAIMSDWLVVGKDMSQAIKAYKRQLSGKDEKDSI